MMNVVFGQYIFFGICDTVELGKENAHDLLIPDHNSLSKASALKVNAALR